MKHVSILKKTKLFVRNLAKLFYYLFNSESEFGKVFQTYTRCSFANNVKVYSPCSLVDTNIGLGSYIGPYSSIQRTEIGKYCSIGPNFFCGYGQHPLNGLSTAPMFYSTLKQNGISLVDNSFFEEYQRITIGNDVFIGANVTILDGVVVGDGAVIGAGAVVTKNIPPYAIVVGVPARVIKYRFTKEQITELLKIKWWDWPIDKLKGVSGLFFDIDEFIAKHRVE